MWTNIGLFRVKVIIWYLFLSFLFFLTPIHALAQIVANAGPDQAVYEGDTVTLSSAGSSESPLMWTQIAGPDFGFSPTSEPNPTFTAPSAGGKIVTLTFQLRVGGAEIGPTATDTVKVFVCPAKTIVSNIPAGLANAGQPLAITVSNGTIVASTVNHPNAYTDTLGWNNGSRPDDLPNGLVDVTISSTSSITSTITFYLPTVAPPGYGWVKLRPSQGWLDMSSRVLFSPDRAVVTMTVTDGGDTDDNSTPNVIRDPSGLALMPSSTGDSGGGGGGGGGTCFIATAAYDSYLDPRVQVLRNFRDTYLAGNATGRYLIMIYNTYSPPVAEFIRQHEIFKYGARLALTPVIYSIEYPLIPGFLIIIIGGILIRRRRSK